jgi:uncharacterized protein RhaS with RHS repeats
VKRDYENLLTSVTLPGSGDTVSFKYDPMGRRIQKSGANTTPTYVYDGDGGSVIEEVNLSGNVVARYSQSLETDEPLTEFRWLPS